MTKLCCFEQGNCHFWAVRASRRTDCKWTVPDSLERMGSPKTFYFDPGGLSRLGRHIRKVSWTPAEA